MAVIYKITNMVNGMAYVGTTKKDINERWHIHCSDSRRNRCKNRRLYNAIQEYGEANFDISIIEECEDGIAYNREKMWIDKLDTFRNGYNMTYGGAGKPYIDHAEVIKLYNDLQNMREVARKLNVNWSTVVNVLTMNNIARKTSDDINKQEYGKRVSAFTSDNKHLCDFDSLKDAARWISCDSQKTKSISVNIGRVCNGQRKMAYGYVWRYS